jgi:preprotein translocase subunit SecG
MTFDWGTSGALSMSIHSQKKRGKNKKTTINRTEFSPFSHKSTWFCFVLFFFFSFLFASFGGRKKERKKQETSSFGWIITLQRDPNVTHGRSNTRDGGSLSISRRLFSTSFWVSSLVHEPLRL